MRFILVFFSFAFISFPSHAAVHLSVQCVDTAGSGILASCGLPISSQASGWIDVITSLDDFDAKTSGCPTFNRDSGWNYSYISGVGYSINRFYTTSANSPLMNCAIVLYDNVICDDGTFAPEEALCGITPVMPNYSSLFFYSVILLTGALSAAVFAFSIRM